VLNSTGSGITRSNPADEIAQFIFSPCLRTIRGRDRFRWGSRDKRIDRRAELVEAGSPSIL
jgi:hypothetical protein